MDEVSQAPCTARDLRAIVKMLDASDTPGDAEVVLVVVEQPDGVEEPLGLARPAPLTHSGGRFKLRLRAI